MRQHILFDKFENHYLHHNRDQKGTVTAIYYGYLVWIRIRWGGARIGKWDNNEIYW